MIVIFHFNPSFHIRNIGSVKEFLFQNRKIIIYNKSIYYDYYKCQYNLNKCQYNLTQMPFFDTKSR